MVLSAAVLCFCMQMTVMYWLSERTIWVIFMILSVHWYYLMLFRKDMLFSLLHRLATKNLLFEVCLPVYVPRLWREMNHFYSQIYHHQSFSSQGVGLLVDLFWSHASSSLFSGLPCLPLPFGV